jgi:hypothetical protein
MTTLTDKQKKDLKSYTKLKIQASAIDKNIEELKPLVREALMSVNAEDNPVVTEDGKLTLRPRRNWTYSKDLEARIAKVKADQKLEEATGKATFTTSYDVYFKQCLIDLRNCLC